MKRSTPIIAALCLLATGCPDGRSSRNPQTVNDIARVEADVQGLKARVNAIEGGNSDVKSLEKRVAALEARPVNVYVSGGGGPVTDWKQGQGEAGPQPAPTKTAGPDTTPSKGDGDTSPVQEGEKTGVDAWNTLRPRAKGEQPTKGGRVRVCFSAQPDKLNTHLDNSAVTSYITAYINETLVEQNGVTFEMEPLLAKSWTQEDMLFEIVGSEAIDKVEFVASQQK